MPFKKLKDHMLEKSTLGNLIRFYNTILNNLNTLFGTELSLYNFLRKGPGILSRFFIMATFNSCVE